MVKSMEIQCKQCGIIGEIITVLWDGVPMGKNECKWWSVDELERCGRCMRRPPTVKWRIKCFNIWKNGMKGLVWRKEINGDFCHREDSYRWRLVNILTEGTVVSFHNELSARSVLKEHVKGTVVI